MSLDLPEIAGCGFHFEETPVGWKRRTFGRTVRESDLAAFIGCTGMLETLFTNRQVDENGDAAAQIVPGALVYTFAEGLVLASTLQGTGVAFLGMDLKVESPTYVNDTIHAEIEVLEARRSRSKPDLGLVRTRISVYNQVGECVLAYTPLRMVKAKGP